MNISQAKKINIVDFLRAQGYTPAKEDQRQAWFCSPFRSENTPSFKVDKQKNIWFDHGDATGGNIIDLALRIFNTNSLSTALHRLQNLPFSFHLQNDFFNTQNPIPEETVDNSDPQTLTLREVKKLNNTRLIEYLTARAVTLNVAKTYLKEVDFTHNPSGKNYFALAFPNDDGGYEIRNKYFKGCIGKKQISSFRNNNHTLLIFEGMFDFLSHRSFYPDNQADYLVLNSVALAPRAVTVAEQYPNVELFFDNDPAGRNAVRLFPQAVDRATGLYPEDKDLNEYCLRNPKNNP